ncbi:MAG: hypothetical protein LBB61_03090 [Treponema sp.]|nr:hypothetical protein [Treponema sp.]
MEFDVAKPWILSIEEPSLRYLADELARYIELLRIRAGVKQKLPRVLEIQEVPSMYAPLVALRYGAGKGNGFSWRFSREELDVQGDSVRGMYNAVFDFLVKLGFSWKTPFHEEPPRNRGNAGHAYALDEDHGYSGSVTDIRSIRRLLFNKRSVRNWEKWIAWAVRNRIDTVVLPLSINPARQLFEKINKAAKKYDLAIEAGGRDLSSLVRRSLFPHKEIFRMADGKRDRTLIFVLLRLKPSRFCRKRRKSFS